MLRTLNKHEMIKSVRFKQCATLGSHLKDFELFTTAAEYKRNGVTRHSRGSTVVEKPK